MTDPTPTLTDEQREELAGALHDALRCNCDSGESDRMVADALAPLIARMVADAGCELQRTGDGTHGPLIRQAKAEGWDEGYDAAAWRSFRRTDISIGRADEANPPNPYRADRVGGQR